MKVKSGKQSKRELLEIQKWFEKEKFVNVFLNPIKLKKIAKEVTRRIKRADKIVGGLFLESRILTSAVGLMANLPICIVNFEELIEGEIKPKEKVVIVQAKLDKKIVKLLSFIRRKKATIMKIITVSAKKDLIQDIRSKGYFVESLIVYN